MDHTYAAWLGPAAEDLTPDQLERFTRAADMYYALPLHEGRDPQDRDQCQAEDDAALSAILQSILGEGTLTEAGERDRAARAALIGWVRAAHAMGEPILSIAQRAGITRPTVRAWIGR